MKSPVKKVFGQGFKRTPQRLAILAYLEGNTSHPSAEEIYRKVLKKHPTISFATVYNTLDALKLSGAIQELKVDPERGRFDPNPEPHHHLICLACRKIMDFPADIHVDLPRGSAGDFSVVGSHIEFYGYCKACAKKGTRRAGDRHLRISRV